MLANRDELLHLLDTAPPARADKVIDLTLALLRRAEAQPSATRHLAVDSFAELFSRLVAVEAHIPEGTTGALAELVSSFNARLRDQVDYMDALMRLEKLPEDDEEMSPRAAAAADAAYYSAGKEGWVSLEDGLAEIESE